MHRLKAEKKGERDFDRVGKWDEWQREGELGRERSVTRLDQVQPLLDIFDQLIDEGRNGWRRRFCKFDSSKFSIDYRYFYRLITLFKILIFTHPSIRLHV